MLKVSSITRIHLRLLHEASAVVRVDNINNHRQCRGDVRADAEDAVRFARPEQIAGRRVPAPTAGLTQGLSRGQKRFASTDGFLRLLSLNALRDRVGDRGQGFRRGLADGFARKHREDAHQLAAGKQWKAPKRGWAVAANGMQIAQGRIVDVVRDVGTSLLSDEAYPRLTNADETMDAIEVRGGSRAGMKLEELLIFRDHPDAGRRSVQVSHDGFRA